MHVSITPNLNLFLIKMQINIKSAKLSDKKTKHCYKPLFVLLLAYI